MFILRWWNGTRARWSVPHLLVVEVPYHLLSSVSQQQHRASQSRKSGVGFLFRLYYCGKSPYSLTLSSLLPCCKYHQLDSGEGNLKNRWDLVRRMSNPNTLGSSHCAIFLACRGTANPNSVTKGTMLFVRSLSHHNKNLFIILFGVFFVVD